MGGRGRDEPPLTFGRRGLHSGLGRIPAAKVLRLRHWRDVSDIGPGPALVPLQDSRFKTSRFKIQDSRFKTDYARFPREFLEKHTNEPHLELFLVLGPEESLKSFRAPQEKRVVHG